MTELQNLEVKIMKNRKRISNFQENVNRLCKIDSCVDSLFGTITLGSLQSTTMLLLLSKLPIFQAKLRIFQKIPQFSVQMIQSIIVKLHLLKQKYWIPSQNLRFQHKAMQTLNKSERNDEQLIGWRLQWHSRQNRVTVNTKTTQANWCIRV